MPNGKPKGWFKKRPYSRGRVANFRGNPENFEAMLQRCRFGSDALGSYNTDQPTGKSTNSKGNRGGQGQNYSSEAESVQRPAVNRKIAGSNPAGGAKFRGNSEVECRTVNADVGGSNPSLGAFQSKDVISRRDLSKFASTLMFIKISNPAQSKGNTFSDLSLQK